MSICQGAGSCEQYVVFGLDIANESFLDKEIVGS